MAAESDVKIGKFDILATYTYASALLDGIPGDEAKQRGIDAAIMGAKAKLGHSGGSRKDHETEKTAAEKKKKTTITAEMFDHQVADKMGDFFDKTFLPAIKKMVEASMSYDEVKEATQDPLDVGSEDHQRTVQGACGARQGVKLLVCAWTDSLPRGIFSRGGGRMDIIRSGRLVGTFHGYKPGRICELSMGFNGVRFGKRFANRLPNLTPLIAVYSNTL